MHLPFRLEPKHQSRLYVKVILQVINLVFSSRLGSESVATTRKSNHSSSCNWSQNYRMILTLFFFSSRDSSTRTKQPSHRLTANSETCKLKPILNIQVIHLSWLQNNQTNKQQKQLLLERKLRKEKRKWHILITVCPCQLDFGRFGVMTVHHSTPNSSQPCRQRLLALTNSPFGTPEFIAALSAAQSVLYRNNLMMLALD